MVESLEIKADFQKTNIGIIPNDWEVKKLGDGINLLSGHHVLAQYCNTEGNGFPYITGPADFPSGTIQHSKFTMKPTTICRSNDILVTVKGSGSGTIVLADAEYCISRQLMAVRVTDWDNRYIYYSLMQDESVFGAVATGLIPGLSRSDILNKLILLPPTKAEQTAIATALNDTDALIAQLEKLIAKKRNIKQGAMQELLKPKEGWEVKKLRKVLKVKHGKSQKKVNDDNGIYPILASGGVIGKANRFLYDKPSVLIGRKGTIDKPQFMDTPFWTVDTLFYTEIFENYNAKYIFYMFNLIDWYSYNEASGVPSLNAKTIEKIEKAFPRTKSEQTRIAQILSDMDAEIEALEKKLEKYKMIKQGMMQNLLTGKIRLV